MWCKAAEHRKGRGSDDERGLRCQAVNGVMKKLASRPEVEGLARLAHVVAAAARGQGSAVSRKVLSEML